MSDTHILASLSETILSRRGGDPKTSYTLRLFAMGREKLAQKLAEEATEAVIEAIKGDKERLTQESADLLYHLLVIWAEAGVTPAEVWKVLESRTGQSGIDEKQSRKIQ